MESLIMRTCSGGLIRRHYVAKKAWKDMRSCFRGGMRGRFWELLVCWCWFRRQRGVVWRIFEKENSQRELRERVVGPKLVVIDEAGHEIYVDRQKRRIWSF